jgi:large subunit ribosomal protein L17e
VEKEQAIKLIRAIVEIGSERAESPGVPGAGAVPLSEPIMRAIIAVAEHAEDPFRPICIQTLAEICKLPSAPFLDVSTDVYTVIIDIDLVARTGGIRFLLHALGEGPTEMGMFLATAFLSVIDSPRKRAYFRLGTDLEVSCFWLKRRSASYAILDCIFSSNRCLR